MGMKLVKEMLSLIKGDLWGRSFFEAAACGLFIIKPSGG